MKDFPRINLLVNGAGLYEPPSSNFWELPGVSPLAKDAVDARVASTILSQSIQLRLSAWLKLPLTTGWRTGMWRPTCCGLLVWVHMFTQYIHPCILLARPPSSLWSGHLLHLASHSESRTPLSAQEQFTYVLNSKITTKAY